MDRSWLRLPVKLRKIYEILRILRSGRTAQLDPMMSRFAFTLFAALASVVPHSAFGQTRIEDAVSAIKPGTMVRVAINDSAYVGRLLSATPTDVMLDRYGTPLSIPTLGISRVWVAQGRATWDGFLAGAVVGGVVGLGIGFLFGGMWCESNCAVTWASNMLTAGLLGAGAVGAAGAAIGSLTHHWSPRYP
jgi:hypothetical protein